MHMLHKRRRLPPVLSIEHLEVRNLLSVVPLADATIVFAEVESNNTLDRANELGILAPTVVTGDVDSHGSDVDWFVFDLAQPSEVTLNATAGTIGLYNNSNGDFNDRLDPFGHRLLVQAGASNSSGAQIVRRLAAGTYFVAVSGGGNLYFNPFIEHSGLPGTSGSYELSLLATSLDVSGDDDPIALAVDTSALIVRFDLSSALTFAPTVELTDALGTNLPMLWTNHNAGTAELQIAPTQPFTPGDFQAVVKDEVGNIRLTLPFQVAAEGSGDAVDLGNDTPATSVSLGDLEQLGLVQIVAAIGDDARYDFSSLEPAFQPGNDVDLYHFHIGATTPIGLQAEVFAGRINSPLDAGLSLFRLDPVTGHLQFVAGNNQSYNPTPSTNRASSLFYDPLLTVSLSTGDYYLAVSQGSNTLSPTEYQLREDGSGIFDPEITQSGTIGWNVGPYVLNVQAVAIPDPPQVASVSIVSESVLTSAPTAFSVQFTEYMNLTELAFAAFQATSQSTIAGVYIQDASGSKTFPRLISYDPTSFTAEFLMLDRLATGTYQLHLSGNQGLTNIAGGALVGNTEEGDYVVQFEVATAAAGTNGNPLVWTHVEGSNEGNAPQDLGVIFPHELQAGVQIVRIDEEGSSGKSDKSDAYQFEILQNQTYLLNLSGDSLPKDVGLQLMDQLGNPILGLGLNDGHTLFLQLRAGTYTLHVGDWSAAQSRHLSYRIEFNLEGIGDNAPPLFSGPSPAVSIRLATSVGPIGLPGPGSGVPLPGTSSSGISGSSSAASGSTNVGTNGSASVTPLNIERLSLPRIVLPTDPGNVAIAIPAFTSLAGDGSGVISPATRTIRRTPLKGNGPEYRGLVRLADGPIGTVNPDKPDHLSSTMTALRKLNNLIGATFSSEVTQRNETKAEESRDRTPANDATDSPDHNADLLNADVDTNENDRTGEKAEQGESHAVRTPASDQLQSRVTSGSNTGNDSAFMLPDGDFAELASSPLTLDANALWAAGIGAVLLHLASDGVTPATSQVCSDTRLQVSKRHEKHLRTQLSRNTTT